MTAGEERFEKTSHWRGWAIAVSVYLLAVMHRTSLGVAGLRAEQRFGISPTELSVFVFVQLGVYAAMQIPTGLLVDRFGPRRLLITASLVMGTAQLLFASVPSYPAAVAARALLGVGDAMTFISVLRFVAAYFDGRRYPLLVTLTAMVGTVGNIVATLPLAVLLRSIGWTTTFTIAACLSLVTGALVSLFLPDAQHVARRDAPGWSSVRSDVAAAWALPGTRMGFWVHFTSMSTATVFGVLWGSVYLVKAAGFSATSAGAILMAGVIVAALLSPVFGAAIGRHPVARVPIGLIVTITTILGWLVTSLALGDHPPQVWIIALFLVMMLGGPVSMAAFAIARDYNGPQTLGTASGVVNVGGFLATIISALGIGIALDAQHGISAHALRYAVLVAIGVQALGLTRVIFWFLRVRALALLAAERGEPTLYPVIRHRWDIALVPTMDEGTLAAEEELEPAPSTSTRRRDIAGK